MKTKDNLLRRSDLLKVSPEGAYSIHKDSAIKGMIKSGSDGCNGTTWLPTNRNFIFTDSEFYKNKHPGQWTDYGHFTKKQASAGAFNLHRSSIRESSYAPMKDCIFDPAAIYNRKFKKT